MDKFFDLFIRDLSGNGVNRMRLFLKMFDDDSYPDWMDNDHFL